MITAAETVAHADPEPIGSRAVVGRARLIARWSRFALQSARHGDFDFCLNAGVAIGSTLRMSLGDLVPRTPRVACNVCGWSGHRFYPNVGPGYDERDTLCPGCRTLDRHRSLVRILSRATTIFTDACRVIEVAPMRAFQSLCVAHERMDYTSFDLARFAMERGDITDMRYANAEADYFVCFHVLEHIPDERTALAEIRRVLKPGGTLVIQVPIDRSVERTYDYDAPDPREVGHVRRYGRDFAERMRSAGFDVTETSVRDVATPDEITRHRLCPNPVYLCRRTIDSH